MSDSTRNASPMIVIAAIFRHRSRKPSALANTPTVTGWYQAEGNDRPMIFAVPDRDDTGAKRPEKFTAGTMERIAVAKTAATWVRTKEEMSWPNPVVAKT